LHAKSGSPDVWVYELKGISNVIEHILPFFEKYIVPFGCKNKEYNIFKEVVLRMENKDHLSKEGLSDLIRLIYTYEGKGKFSPEEPQGGSWTSYRGKRSLNEVLSIVSDKEAYFSSLATKNEIVDLTEI